jgi:hypothetical protein
MDRVTLKISPLPSSKTTTSFMLARDEQMLRHSWSRLLVSAFSESFIFTLAFVSAVNQFFRLLEVPLILLDGVSVLAGITISFFERDKNRSPIGIWNLGSKAMQVTDANPIGIPSVH